jgi:L,D-transpeptidase ErfK/SrfK
MPVVGQYEKDVVKRGESLFEFARRHNVSLTALRRANRLKSNSAKAGTRLILPTLHILPRAPQEGVVLNIPERALYLFSAGKLLARYPVAIGQSTWQTALGEFKVRNKIKDPSWKPTREMVEREGVSPDEVPPGPRNPLGDRWMGWSAPGFGFHSTLNPRSIGTAASHGCVRLYPEGARKLFESIQVGMPIYSVYEPILVGRIEGKFYLTVFPDVYNTGLATFERAMEKLTAAGIAGVVDQAVIQRVVARVEGYPQRIVGSDEPLTVNGVPIKAAIDSTLVGGRWLVPIREVATALGGQITLQNESIQVTGNGHALTVRPGDVNAELDGRQITLPVAPAVVQGVTMVPLASLAESLGAKVAFEKGKGISVTTAPSTSPPPAVGTSPPGR